MGLLILGLVLFVLLIVAHEYGHFLVAKRNGVDVEEFGIGFPPKLYGKKIGRGVFEGYYTLNLLPLGGFVKLKGEHDADTEKGTFGAASTRVKLKILLAGVAVNFAVALFLFTVVAWIGMPQLVPNQFAVKSDQKVTRSDVFSGNVVPNSPAAKANIRQGDIIKSLASQQVSSSAQLVEVAKLNAGKTVPVTYARKGEIKNSQVTLLSTTEVEASKNTNSPRGYIGIAPKEYRLVRSTWSAPIVAAGTSTQLAWLTIKTIGTSLASLGKALASAITGQGATAKKEVAKAGENVSGPVGIFAVLQQSTVLGYQFILFIVALISLTLAIMNALPIPALDGGRAFVMLGFRAFKKPLNEKTEEMIHGTGFLILITLFVLITVVDVKRFY